MLARPFGLLALVTLGVSLRRRTPWGAYALVWLALVGDLAVKTGGVAGLAMFVVLYTVASRSPMTPSLLALLGALLAQFVAIWPDEVLAGFRFVGVDAAGLVLTNWAWLGLAWFAGRMQARRQTTASDLERTVGELKREQEWP